MTSNSQKLEQAYYDSGGVRVTAITVRDRDRSYPTSSIVGVDIQTEKPDRRRPFLFILCGVLLLILGIGIIFVIIGIWWLFSQWPVYRLVIQTKTHNNTLCRSTDIQALKPIQAALKIAISHSQATVKLLNAARQKNGLLSTRDALTATGLDVSALLSLLDSLVISGYATQREDLKTGATLYNFKKVLSGMDTLLVVARAKRNMLSVDDAVLATGFYVSDLQIILDSLVISGYATLSQDLRADVTLYKFSHADIN